MDTANSKLFEVAWIGGTAFRFYLDGALVATITTTIPAASDRFGMFWCSDNKSTATAVGATFNSMHLMLK